MTIAELNAKRIARGYMAAVLRTGDGVHDLPRREGRVHGKRNEQNEQGEGEIQCETNVDGVNAWETAPWRAPGPMLTFIDDDARSDFPGAWESILQDTGIPMTCAVITGSIGNPSGSFMTWEQIQEMHGVYGVEMISHGCTHVDFTLLTDAEIMEELTLSKQALLDHGCDACGFVYPYGRFDQRVKELVKRVYRCGIRTGMNNPNTPPLFTYALQRYNLDNDENPTFPTFKAQIDRAIAENGWLIYMSHSQNETFDENIKAAIRQIIDYCRTNGVEIVGVEQGLDRIGNVMEAGAADRPDGSTYFVVDAYGRADTSQGKWRRIAGVTLSADQAGIVIDKDDQGNAFRLSKVRLLARNVGAVGNEAIAFRYMYFNFDTPTYAVCTFPQVAEGSVTVLLYEAEYKGGWWDVKRSAHSGIDYADSAFIQQFVGRETPEPPIEKIWLNEIVFGAGSQITLWGVDA